MRTDSRPDSGFTPEDRAKLEQARGGDQNAFMELVKRYENRVAATVIGMLGHGPEAEDVGQEVFVRFYKALSRFRGDSSLGTYLTRIAINLSLNAIKRRTRQRGMFFSDSEGKMAFVPDTRGQGSHHEAVTLVQRGLQQLSPRDRTVVVLRLVDGYSTRETAEILRLPQGTVLSRLSRAQERLKKILDPLYHDMRDQTGDDNGKQAQETNHQIS